MKSDSLAYIIGIIFMLIIIVMAGFDHLRGWVGGLLYLVCLFGTLGITLFVKVAT